MDFIALQRAKLHYVFENIFHVVERLVSEKEAKMNKIFKVIWSKSKQCYVVVSELAKNTTGKKKIIVASILAAMVAGQAMQVEAAYGKISPSNGTGSLAISGAGGSPATASTDDAIAVGQDASATGRGGIAVGRKSNSVHNALSLGWIASAKNTGAIAIGSALEEPGVPGEKEVVSEGFYSIAIGGASQSSGSTSIALGVKSSATKESATAIGKSSNASGIGAFAAGLQTNASGAGSIAIGGATSDTASNGATASGAASIAMGYKSKASSQNAVSIGSESKAQELNAIAIGTNTNVTKQNATAVGSGASVTGHNATAVGNETTAIEQYDNAFGYKSTAKGGASTALGYYATSSGNNSVALGSQVNTTGIAATGIGYTVTSSGNRSVALGASITSNGDYATGIGYSVNSNGEGAIAIGAGTDTLGAIPAKQVEATMKNAIAIGRATSATGESATAIGTEATASTSDAIAVGRKSNASGGTSISFGYNTKATSTNSVAIGTDVSATAESAIALGRKTTASDLNATAVGPLANASGNSASAFGMSATASKAESLALGTSAYASLDKSVALGSNSTTATNATSQGSVIIGGKTISWNGAPTVTGTGMQVSVGSAGAERQIKNVAAGEVSANSTDAINGSQLYAVAEGLRTKYVSINSTVANNQNNDGATGSNSMAIGPNASATKADSVAVGINAQVTGSNSVAIGNTALAKQDYNVAMGSEVTADGNNSVAMGRMASSTGMASLAIGTYGYNNSTASGKYSIAIGRDVTSSAEDAIAMGRNSQATANYALALGAEANASQASGVALGYASTADTAAGVAGYNANTGRSDTYTALSGNVLTSTLGAVSVGNSTNTRQITGVAAGKADTDAVNVAQLKSVNLAFTGNSGSGDVNLSKSKLAVEGGTDSFVTTTAANKKLEINTTQGKLKTTSGTVSVDGNNGLAVAQNVADVINQANADRTITYKANGTGSNSVKLSDGLNFTNGTTTTATVGTNGQVSFDLNTTTQKSITDSATAVARTISLGGDTGTTTAKSLTSGNVNFGIKSGSSTYLTTTANGNDVTLTVNEQAIKDAAKDASSFKVKANTNTAEDVKGGDTVAFNDGDNIAITQTGKTFKIATAKNVTFDAATIGGNTTIGSTGITTNKVTVGTISIDGTNGINAGNKAITNVGTGRVANSNADDTNVANIGDVKAIATDAVANLSTNLSITDGTTSGTVNLKNQSLKVVGTGAAKATVSGQTITVDVAKGTLTANSTTGALTGTTGVVDANDMASAVNTAITKAVDNATGTQALNLTDGTHTGTVKLSTQTLSVSGTNGVQATVGGQGITIGLDTATKNLITNSSTAVDNLGKNTFTLKADSTDTTAQDLNKSGGLAFKVAGDGNFTSTSAAGDTVTVSVKQGVFGSNADGTAKSTTNGVATTDKVADIVNTTVSNAVNNVTSNQNLKIGGDTTAANSAVNLKNDTLSVKGDNKFISTAASGNDITLTVNEQAIKDAAKDASSFKVKANSTAAEDVKGGDTVAFNDGDNIAITQTGKTFKIATAKNVTFDAATIGGNTTIGSTGVTTNKVTVGGISIDGTNGINAGSKQITNVASGGTTVTNAANIGDVDTKVTTAINDLTTNLTKNTTIAYTANTATPGQTVSLKDGFNFSNGTLTTAEVAANGVVKFNVTQGSLSTDGNGNITNTAGVATTDDVKNAVNTAINKAVTNSSTAVNTLGANTFTLTGDNSTSTTGQALNKNGGLSFKVAGDGNFITTSAATDTVTVSIKQGTFGSNADGTAKSTTNGVATTDKVADIVNTTVSNAVNNVTSNQNLKIGGDTTAANSAVNLKNDTLSVKGDNKFISTAASGNDITLTVNEQAIKDAAKDASSFKVKANSTAAEDVKGGDTVAFNDGDNIAITQTGKTFKIATAKNVTFDAATIGGNTTIGSTGITTNKVTVGTVSIDGTNGINAGNKAITNVGTGIVANSNADNSNVANIGDVKTIATDAVANLSTNLGVTDGTNNGTVNLKTEKLKVVGTGAAKATVSGQTITVDVAKGTLTANSATGALTGTAGVVDANDMASAVNTAITKAVDNATGTQALNLTDGTHTGTVKLSTQTLSVSGTNGVQATVGGQGITIGLDTATKNLITNSSTAVDNLGKNTFTLKADSTDTTAQDLNKSGGLAFKVAGDGNFTSTSAAGDTVTVSVKQGVFGSNADGTAKSTTNGVATTDKVADIVNTTVSNAVNNVTSNQNLKIGGDTTAANSAVNLKNDTLSVKGDNKFISTAASGNDITLTVNEQAIKDAAKDASSFKVKANSTAAEDVKGGDTVAFNDGDNIAITQTGKTFKIATAKNVTFDAATIGGNTTIGSTGVTTNKVTVGGISIDGTNGINAGSKQITNVASGGTTVTNAANIGDVDTKVTTAINDLTTNLTKNTTIAYTANTATPGQTVSLKDGFNFSNGTLTTAEVAANGVVKFNVTQGSLSTDGNGNITNTAGVATTDDVKNAVNTAINKAVTNSSTAVNTLGANTFTLTGDNSTSTTGQALNKNGGLSFKVAGDGNFITTSAATDTVTVSIKQGTFGSNTDGTAKSTTNGVATTNDVANIVNTTVTNAVTKATGSQVLNITDGTNNDSINLKNDTLKVVGTDGVTTAVSGKTITVGLDTATKDKINNASAATNKNISLAADTGTVSSQSLKDGDVSFAVKGATGDYISTNMNGSTVEISTKRATINSNAATGEASVTGNDGLVTAKNVADAINAATAKAVSQSAWKLAADGTTGTETISGGDTVNFKAGSNMEVSRTGKDITYKTKDNVAFTTVTAGTGANEVKLDGNTGTVTAKDITATGDVTAKNVTTSGNVTAAGTVKGDTVQGNTVKAGNVTITGGTTNTITGLSNTTWTPAGGIQADRAATEGQLQQAINQVNATVGSTALTFKGDTNPAQSMTLQGNTFAITGDTMIKTTTNTNGIGLSLDTSKVNIAYAANGLNGQTTSIASGFNFTDGDHTKATVDSNGVVKYNAKTSTISVANGHAAASGNDLATADNVADAINQMTQNNSGNTTQLRQEISKVATETQRVGAHAAAMAALKPIQYDPLAPTQIMAGVGNYRGESAAALGIAHYTNDNTMFNVGVSVGGNHNMINAGVTHKFGISAEKKNIPDRYKAGPISSIYVMQDEMTQLRSENEAYKAKLDKQQSEIDALKAAVDQLLASKA